MKRPRPGAIGFHDAAAAVNEAAGGEVGALHELQDVGQRGVGIVHQRDGAIHNLRQIMRRDVGSHADRNAVRAVDQQIGNSRRQHDRLDRGVVEIGDEVDGVLVDIGQQLFGNFGKARLGVPVSCGRIAID